jgi:hypothetical protein
MALEAWGHSQIDVGRPFEDVLHDVLGPDGSSVAFVCVAVDLALSHWAEAADTVWPIVATPEVLEFDDARALRDLAGIDRMTLEQEPSTWRVRRAELDVKPSRRARLSDQIGHYVFHGRPGQLEALRAALEQARDEIKKKRNDHEDPVDGLTATAERAVRMTDAQHWPLVKVTAGIRSAGASVPARPSRTKADGRKGEARAGQFGASERPSEVASGAFGSRRIERGTRRSGYRVGEVR